MGIGFLTLLEVLDWRAPRLIVDADGHRESAKVRLAWSDIASMRMVDGFLTVVAPRRPQLLPADERVAASA